MKRLILLLSIAIPALATDPVQTKVCSSVLSAAFLDCSFTSLPGVNSLIVGFVRITGGSNTNLAYTWSDNQGNTYQEDIHALLANLTTRGVSLGSGIAATSAGTFTVRVTPNSLATFWSMIISEYANTKTSNWRDGAAISATSGAGTATTGGCGTIAASANNTIAFTAVGPSVTVNDTNFTLDSGFTVDAQDLGGAAFHESAVGHKILTTTAGVTPVWSWQNLQPWTAVCAIYKESNFGGAAVKHRATQQ